MEKVIVDLAAALRERLAIIADEASRRDNEKHIARLRATAGGVPAIRSIPLAYYLQCRRRTTEKIASALTMPSVGW